MRRELTKKIPIGSMTIGGSPAVLIQSMCDIKTSRFEEVAAEINRCAELGADLMRVSVLDMDDAKAIAEIKKRIRVPLVADIHFDAELAVAAIENGADAIRLNPGNIQKKEDIERIAALAKEKRIPIRIGVNSGSLPEGHGSLPERMVQAASDEIRLLEDCGFADIVISLKASSVRDTVEAYRLAANRFPYPLHLGVTEAGPKNIGLIRSAAALSPLLLEGIGDTIRISLTEKPEEEVKAAYRLLVDLGLRKGPRLISCPTCGRTEVNLKPMARAVQDFLDGRNDPIAIAVMGCAVNGPGEAREADIGVAAAKNEWILFVKGKPVRPLEKEDPIRDFLTAISEYLSD